MALSNEDLVREWQEGLTGRAIAEKHGVSERTVIVRVTILRKRGVPLTRRKHLLTIDVEALTKLAKQYAKK